MNEHVTESFEWLIDYFNDRADNYKNSLNRNDFEDGRYSSFKHAAKMIEIKYEFLKGIFKTNQHELPTSVRHIN